jgi:hypothetical protein
MDRTRFPIGSRVRYTIEALSFVTGPIPEPHRHQVIATCMTFRATIVNHEGPNPQCITVDFGYGPLPVAASFLEPDA